MRHAYLVVLLAIAVLAGFTSRTVLDSAPFERETRTGAPDTETAHAFYTALNAALAGASAEPLAAILSSIFVDHDSETGTSRSGEAFLEEVRTMGASLQRIRLEVISIDAVGEALIVGIRPVVLESIEVAALRIEVPEPEPEPYYEVIRFARGKLIDRWSRGLSGIGVSASVDDPVAISSTTGIATTVRRIELTGAIEGTWRSTGVGIVLVESGSVVLQTTLRNDAGPAMIVKQGDVASIDPGMRVRIRAEGEVTASVLLYTVDRIVATDHAPSTGGLHAIEQDGLVTLLWNGHSSGDPSRTEHRAVQIVLPAGEVLDLQQSDGSSVMVVVDTGILQITIPAGTVSMLDANRWPETLVGSAQIEAHRAGLIHGNGPVTLRNLTDEPISLTLISVSGR